MNTDELNPEYPEHLNPFRKRRNTLTRSFRGIKNAIVRSLTGKEKEKPIILRPKQGNEPTNRTVFSMPPSISAAPPVALPRSRFSERLSKTDTLRALKINKNSIGPNPFDDGNEKETADASLPPKPAARTKHKRKKKKTAPVPPGSVNGGSKWSLNSTESDLSSIGFYSEADIDYIDASIVDNEEIFNLTREIAKFAEDTNNNNIPNNVQSDDSNKVDESNENEKTEKEEEREANGNLKELSNVDPEDPKSEEQKIIQEDNTVNAIVINELLEVHETIVAETPGKDDGNSLNSHKENSSSVDEDTAESKDIATVQQVVEHYEKISASPNPKVRKNILTKENLLGSDNV